jgi:methionyl-tRNA formyltransferase
VERVSIESLDTAQTVETKLSASCIPLVQRTLGPLAEGTLEFQPQDDAQATFCRRLTKEDGALDFSKSATDLAARINGLFPWPACSVEIEGQPIKFGLADTLRADVSSPATVPAPGTTVESVDGTLWVSTANGILRVRQLQRPGGRMLAAAEFLRGFPIRKGTHLASRPMPLLVGPSPLK